MNPSSTWIVLRPRGPLEVFDLTWRFLRETWRPQLRMLAVTLLPVAVLAFVLCGIYRGRPSLLLLPLLLAPWMQMPFTLLTGRLLFDRNTRIRDVLRELLPRTGSLLGGQLVALIGWVFGIGCGGFIFLLPIRMALQFLPEVLLLERLSVFGALRRVGRLAGASAGPALVGVFVRVALALWCAIVAETTGQALFEHVLRLGQPFGAAQEGTVTPFLLVGLLLSQPLHAVFRVLLYVDIRTRSEGWDLQVALRAAGLAA